MTAITSEHSRSGPRAHCKSACGFRMTARMAPFHFLPEQVRREARRHVRETGHEVEIESVSVTIYKPGTKES